MTTQRAKLQSLYSNEDGRPLISRAFCELVQEGLQPVENHFPRAWAAFGVSTEDAE